MNITIKCKFCGGEIEISEALRSQIEKEALEVEKQKHQEELERIKKEASELADQRAEDKLGMRIKSLEQEKQEEKQRNKGFQEQIIELAREVRIANQRADDARLEMQKKLTEEQEKIIQETRKKVEEEHGLKDLEKNKKLQDALKVNEELKRKLEQGSQQTQGEVLELELEDTLRVEFPNDGIKPVPKGIRGADIVQEVIDKKGTVCGKILWESKNAKWNKSWIGKLKEDQRVVGAQFAVLVATDLPPDIKNFRFRDGVWITDRNSFIGLAHSLRMNIGQVFFAKRASAGKDEKMEILYNYLTSTEFSHRVESIADVFTSLQEDLEKEKRWFSVKWARQEKDIDRVIEQTYRMYGDLQSVTGGTLPEIKQLALPEPEDNPGDEPRLSDILVKK